jgi:capsid portal protein
MLNTKHFVVASKDFGLDVDADKTKNMVRSRDQNSGRNRNIKIHESSYEMVEEFIYEYLKTTLTNQTSVQEEIKDRLKSGNAYYHSVQNFGLPVCYPKLKVKIFRTVTLSVVLYGCETWSLMLMEDRRLKVFVNTWS